jgi:hypothetical protein
MNREFVIREFCGFEDAEQPSLWHDGILRSKFSLQADRSHSGLRSSSMGLV